MTNTPGPPIKSPLVEKLEGLDRFLEAVRDGCYPVPESAMLMASEYLEGLRDIVRQHEAEPEYIPAMTHADEVISAMGDAPVSTVLQEAEHNQPSLANLVRMRLTQIASGDYRACGHTAEEVALDALKAMGEGPGNSAVESAERHECAGSTPALGASPSLAKSKPLEFDTFGGSSEISVVDPGVLRMGIVDRLGRTMSLGLHDRADVIMSLIRPYLRTTGSAPATESSAFDKALENAAKILANFQDEGQRTKQEEWEACYALCFRQLNDAVQIINELKSRKPSTVDGGDAIYWQKKFLDMQNQWETLAFREPEPVLISLETCARAICPAVGLTIEELKGTSAWRDAKDVLETAGVKYGG